MNIEYKLTGFDELEKKLEALGKPAARSGMFEALHVGGEIIKNSIVQNAPEDTGFLKEHFDTRVSLDAKGTSGIAYIMPTQADYPDADGTFRHKFSKKLGRVIEVGRISVRSVARFLEFGTVKMSKKPFITQGAQAAVPAVLEAVQASLAKSIEGATK